MDGNKTGLWGSVTVSHGANISANTRLDTTVAFPNAVIGDMVLAAPQAAPAAGIVVLPAIRCTVAGQITISVANITTATVSAGTAVVYDIQLLNRSGNDNTP